MIARRPEARSRTPSADALDNGRVGLAATLAHRLQTVARPAPLQLMYQFGHQDGPGRAEWMTERDRATVRVGLVQRRARVGRPSDQHRSERLIDLENVDVRHREARSGEDLLGRGYRAGQHDHRVAARDGKRMDARDWREPMPGNSLLGSHEQRCGAVGDLRGGRGRDLPPLAQRLQRSHLLKRGVAPWALISGDARDRRDLALEPSLVDRLDRLSVARQRELLELAALDPPFFAYQLSAAKLGDLLVAVPAGPAVAPGQRHAQAVHFAAQAVLSPPRPPPQGPGFQKARPGRQSARP